MIVFLNGSFGIGKTSTAKALHALLPGSRIYDPEVIGFYLRRMPRWVPLANRDTGDFQDMPAWQRWAARGMRLARMRSALVIVPMAFSNLAYLNELRDAALRIDPDVRHFCLVAPLEAVLARIAGRGGSVRDLAWQREKATVCCAAHQSADFAVRIDAETLPPDAIARDIARVLRLPAISPVRV